MHAKRFYIIIPILLLGGFLSYYIPWRIDAEREFQMHGPGPLEDVANIEALSFRLPETRNEGIWISRDRAAIDRVVTLLRPNYKDWERGRHPHQGSFELSFTLKNVRTGLRVIGVTVRDRLAVSGNYTRVLDDTTRAQLTAELQATGKFNAH